MVRALLVVASLLGALGVALGAFGAHGLRSRVEPRMLEVWETAVRYQLLHVPALLAVAWASERWRAKPSLGWAAILFIAGVAIFSGSLYALALSGQRWLGAITPIGGFALIGGWLLLGWVALRSEF